METIFDHGVTAEEIEACGFLSDWQRIRHGIGFTVPITPESYKREVTPPAAYFDLYLLYAERKNARKMRKYRSLVPAKVKEYLLGFDYRQIPTSV